MKPKNKFSTFTARNSYAFPAWGLLIVLASICAVRAPYLFTASGIGGLLVSATPLVLVVMGLTMTALVGSGVDLSAGPLMIFVNVILVKFLFEERIGSPAIVIIVALATGVVIEVIEAVVIIVARIEPVIVTLSAFLALSGLNLVILPEPGGLAPNWLASWGSGRSIFAPMTIVLIVAIVAWVLLARTSLYSNIRLVGSNKRTAYVSGSPVPLTQIIAHGISGLLIGAAGLAYTGQIGSGNPTQGGTQTLAAITGLVLGGISLAGGRGGILGSVPGALAVTLISFTLTTFSLGAYASFVVQLAYGAILVLALVVSVIGPTVLQRRREVMVA